MGLSSVIREQKKTIFIFFAISILGPTLSLELHLPYILIAYLNDAAYASSMFIFYTVIVCFDDATSRGTVAANNYTVTLMGVLYRDKITNYDYSWR